MFLVTICFHKTFIIYILKKFQGSFVDILFPYVIEENGYEINISGKVCSFMIVNTLCFLVFLYFLIPCFSKSPKLNSVHTAL